MLFIGWFFGWLVELFLHADGTFYRTKKEIRPFTYKLDFQENDFYKSFDKPGECITRLFSWIEKDNVWKNESETWKVPDLSKRELFKNNTLFDACYSYHWKLQNNDKYQRLEIAVKGKDEGWLWMLASKPNEERNAFKFYFREIVLERRNYIWRVAFAQEGEFKDKAGPEAFKLAEGFKGFGHKKWFNHNTGGDCTLNASEDCTSSNKSIYLYWKKEPKSEKQMKQISLNIDDQIWRWGNKDRKKKITGKTYEWEGTFNNRKRIYLNGKWHNLKQENKINVNEKSSLEEKTKEERIERENKEKEEWSAKTLVLLQRKDLEETRGSWNNLIGFCSNTFNKSNQHYNIYCY